MDTPIIIGIAGHTGHGKTTLARHLLRHCSVLSHHPPPARSRTLPSADRRFYPFALSSGHEATLADIPGNPRYIRTSIRTLCHVDMAVVVIGADDGVMPQTREHIRILHHFGVCAGIIVISKTDMVDEETVSIAELEAAEAAENTFLEGCPVLRFSAQDTPDASPGRSPGPSPDTSPDTFPDAPPNQSPVSSLDDRLRAIRDAISEQALRLASGVSETTGSMKGTDGVPSGSGSQSFRLCIDRVRQFSGFGTVVTGTVLSGCIHKNDPVLLLPGQQAFRARHLQIHGRDVKSICAGNRAGINLHKAHFDKIRKGMVLVSPDTGIPGRFLNAEMHLEDTAASALADRIRIRLYTGTAVTTATVIRIAAAGTGNRPAHKTGTTDSQDNVMVPGTTTLVQLRPAAPLCVFPGDRYVVGLLGDHRIIGGGRMLETTNIKHRRSKSEIAVKRLRAMHSGDLSDYVSLMLNSHPFRILSGKEIADQTLFARAGQHPAVDDEIKRRIDGGEIIDFGTAGVMGKENADRLVEETMEICKKLIKDNSSMKLNVHAGEIGEKIRKRFPGGLSHPALQNALDELCRRQKLIARNGHYQLPLARSQTGGAYRELLDSLREFAARSSPKPFTAGFFCKAHGNRFDKKSVEKFLRHLAEHNELVALNMERFIRPHDLEQAKKRIESAISQRGAFYIQDCHTVLGYGRSQAVPVLEYLDETDFTERVDNARVLKNR